MPLGFGWHQDEPDDRDRLFVPERSVAANLPPSVQFSEPLLQTPVFDQRPLSSCSAHALGAMFYYVNEKEGLPGVVPSRLFIYYNERMIENTIPEDRGAQIRNGIKSIARQGVCDEGDWPYDATKFAQAPPSACYTSALAHRTIEYYSLSGRLQDLKACLAAGYPFVFGMSIYESFTTPAVAQSGGVPMPGAAEKLLGGHAVMAIGYDDSSGTCKIRNSFGSAWGSGGYFTLPYAFMESRHYSDNFWTLRRI